MGEQIGAINLIAEDLERSTAFYRDVFGLPVQHQDEDTAMFRFKDTYVFLQRGAAHEDAPRQPTYSTLPRRALASSSSSSTTSTRYALNWTSTESR